MAQAHYQMGAFREAMGVLSTTGWQREIWLMNIFTGWPNAGGARQSGGGRSNICGVGREHPESPRALEASIGMGFVSAQNEDWNRLLRCCYRPKASSKVGGKGLRRLNFRKEVCCWLSIIEQRDAEAAMVWVKRLPRVMAQSAIGGQLLQARSNGIRPINGCFRDVGLET